MASNPLGIFSAALATGPHTEPIDIGQEMATRNATNAQAAEMQQRAAGIGLANRREAIEQQLEQKRRAIAQKFIKPVPSAPPPAGFPAPPTDASGQPVNDPNYHAAMAQASNPVPHMDWDGYSVALLQAGDPEGAKTAAATGRALREKDLANAKAELDNTRERNAQAGDMLGGMLQAAQPNWQKGDFSIDPKGMTQAQATYQQQKPQLEQLLGRQLPDALDPSWGAPLHGALVGQDKQIAQHNAILTGQKTEAETKRAGAETEQLTAQAGLQAEQTKRMAMQRQMMEQAAKDPDKAQEAIDVLTKDDPELNKQAHAAYIQRMQLEGPEGASKVVGELFSQVAQKRMAVWEKTNPDLVNAEVDLARKKAEATLPTELEKAKQLRQGDNPAVAGVPPQMVNQATTAATKLDEDYNKAKQATDAMGHFLDLAEKGNKAAGSNLPLVGVETLNAINGIKRINRSEIDQYQGAGSLLDRIEGKIGKLVKGQPIPQDVLNDIRELHQALGTQAYNQYTSGLDSLNKRTGAKFGPTLPAPDIRKAATPQYKEGDTRVINGKTVVRDAKGNWNPK